jgi:pimeloyl-ACP methyl ester carboxylesterase
MKRYTCFFAVALGVLHHVAAAATDIHHQTRIEGEGPRSVILESGLGDTLDVWQDVQHRIADRCSRTLAYTRAGYQGSDPPENGLRDAATIVAELRQELHRQRIPPPYVLVGHSLGGLYMQYFARNYPEEVAGLVLVDATHWNQHMELDPTANAPSVYGRMVISFVPWIMRRELKDSVVAGEQVHDSPPAHLLPTIVLSSTIGPKGETPDSRAVAGRLQDDISTDFPGSQHIRVDSASHYIQHDRPDVVIEAARQLAGCSSLESR